MYTEITNITNFTHIIDKTRRKAGGGAIKRTNFRLNVIVSVAVFVYSTGLLQLRIV